MSSRVQDVGRMLAQFEDQYGFSSAVMRRRVLAGKFRNQRWGELYDEYLKLVGPGQGTATLGLTMGAPAENGDGIPESVAAGDVKATPTATAPTHEEDEPPV